MVKAMGLNPGYLLKSFLLYKEFWGFVVLKPTSIETFKNCQIVSIFDASYHFKMQFLQNLMYSILI
jgi:hypothetical protein